MLPRVILVLPRGAVLVALLAGDLAASRAAAQARRPDYLLRADSIALAGDTARALALLDSVVRREPANAAAWHRLGVLAWAFSHPQQERGRVPMSSRTIRLREQADTALRLAVRHAPDSGRYALDLGRYFLQDGFVGVRLQAPHTFGQALAPERKRGIARLAAKVVGGVRDALGRTAEGTDRVTITYTREAPARPVIADYLTLDLAGAGSGRYTLTVEVTDLVSGKSTSRRRELTIEP